MDSDGVPYALFSFTALVPWTFFANSVTESTGSLIQNANMISKIYFPADHPAHGSRTQQAGGLLNRVAVAVWSDGLV